MSAGTSIVMLGLAAAAALVVVVLVMRSRRRRPDRGDRTAHGHVPCRCPHGDAGAGQRRGDRRVTRHQALTLLTLLTVGTAAAAASLVVVTRRQDTGGGATGGAPRSTAVSARDADPGTLINVAGSGNTSSFSPLYRLDGRPLQLDYSVEGSTPLIVGIYLVREPADSGRSGEDEDSTLPVHIVEETGSGRSTVQPAAGTYRLIVDGYSPTCSCGRGCTCPTGFRWSCRATVLDA